MIWLALVVAFGHDGDCDAHCSASDPSQPLSLGIGINAGPVVLYTVEALTPAGG